MSEGPNSFRGAGFIFKTFEDEKEKKETDFFGGLTFWSTLRERSSIVVSFFSAIGKASSVLDV